MHSNECMVSMVTSRSSSVALVQFSEDGLRIISTCAVCSHHTSQACAMLIGKGDASGTFHNP